jgi:hypothetical protein
MMMEECKTHEAKTSDKLDVLDPQSGNFMLECSKPDIGVMTKVRRFLGGQYDEMTPFNLLAAVPASARGRTIVTAFWIMWATMMGAYASTHYVAVDSTNATPPYATWDTASTTIQAAIDEAVDGDVVLVADGVYTLSSQVVLTNGVVLEALNGAGVTTLDGNDACRGIYVSHEDAVVDGFTITNCHIVSGAGAGVSVIGGGIVVNCLVAGNVCNGSYPLKGGGVYLTSGTMLRQCLVVGNTAAGSHVRGGGVYCESGGMVESCTISGNTSDDGGGGVYLYGVILNSIVWGNLGNIAKKQGSSVVSCCYRSDPLFVDSAANDFRLTAGSACIDNGQNQPWHATGKDFAGNERRYQGGTVDIGAYEYKVLSGAERFIYMPTSSNTVAITGYLGDGGAESIPSEIDGTNVTSIGINAFNNADALVSIAIPESITSIGINAFRSCDALTTVGILGSVTNVDDGAFAECGALTNVFLGAGTTRIGNSAFRDCQSLVGISLPDGVASVGEYAFYGCSNLLAVAIPDSITSFGRSSFYGCSNLAMNLAFSANVTNIGVDSFMRSGIRSVHIPDSVSSLGHGAFQYCRMLTSATLPSNLSSVPDRLFAACERLMPIVIPGSVTSIGDTAFGGCDQFTTITIPNSVTNIGSYAFAGCDNMASIVIPDSVTSIGSRAFWFSPSLASVTLGANLRSIGEDCFRYYNSISSITIPDSVTSIGDAAFANCNSLANVVIGAGITGVSKKMFYGCKKLPSVTIPSTITSIGEWGFSDCSSLSSITIPDSVTVIWESAFGACSSLTNVVFGAGIASIKNGAFSACDSLIRVLVPDSVSHMGSSVFSGCSALRDVVMTEGIDSIPESTFSGCSALPTFVIPEAVIDIQPYAFLGCTSVVSAVIGSNVTTINSWAFKGCSGLTNMVIGPSVSSINSLAFYGCSALSDIVVDEGNAWYSSLSGVLLSKTRTAVIACPAAMAGRYRIPDGVAKIGSSAFSGCEDLTSILVPDSVSLIEHAAFWNCKRLGEIGFRGNAPSEPHDSVFSGTPVPYVSYLAGRSGWGATFSGKPTMACTASTPEMIPHDWLLTNFPSIVTTDDCEEAASNDQDGDGMSTWAEYVSGTSPTNRNSTFQVRLRTGNDIVVEWDTSSNRWYSVYASTNLLQTWPTDPIFEVYGDGNLKTFTNSHPNDVTYIRIGVQR